MNELQITSHHKESLENISSDVNMNTAQEKEETSITTPTNTSAAIPLNTMVLQSEEIHTYSEVQAYERKNTISKRVVDETTLRIYFPRHVDSVDTNLLMQTHAEISTSTDFSHPDTATPQTRNTNSRGSLRFQSIHSPSIHTMTS